MSFQIEKLSTTSDSRSTQTHYRLWAEDKVQVSFHQSNKLWIVVHSKVPISKRRFSSFDELKVEFTKMFGVNNND